MVNSRSDQPPNSVGKISLDVKVLTVLPSSFLESPSSQITSSFHDEEPTAFIVTETTSTLSDTLPVNTFVTSTFELLAGLISPTNAGRSLSP